MRKKNFANNLMQIGNVNIQIGPKFKSERLTKNKEDIRLLRSDTIRFDANF